MTTMTTNPVLLIDGYKIDHRRQYPNGTSLIFSNLTARGTRRNIDKTVFFGLQYFIKRFLIEEWNNNFFKVPFARASKAFSRRIQSYIGGTIGKAEMQHLEDLHDLGYLPIDIYALPEGSLVPIGVPSLVIYNTIPEFFWLTNYLETILSCTIWGLCTSATTAYGYKKILSMYAEKTGGDASFVEFQAHDFSFRGMFGLEAAMMSGAAHLTSFQGTDCLPAIDFLEKYYSLDYKNQPIGFSVPATEHSVMCAGGEGNEYETFKRLITELYPAGIISIVSDTWDFWNTITVIAEKLKPLILARDGKVVFRPDSGDPVKIICGDEREIIYSCEYAGAVEVLWGIFGGSINDKGYKELNPKVGLIYGDSITIERAEEICKRLEAKGFASTNIVLGIGSYTYQYVTRDTDGYAVKSTYAEINGEKHEIFKKPKTDSGLKNSARGLLSVYKNENGFALKQSATWGDVLHGEMRPVFINGHLVEEESIYQIRDRLNGN